MRVLIIADNALAAEAIRRGLRHTPGFRVLGFTSGNAPCGATVAEAGPDVVVVDELRDGSVPLARIREARAAAPPAKVVLLASDMDPGRLGQASTAGIDAAVAKATQPACLGVLLREIAAGNVFHAFARTAPAAVEAPATDLLTTRELEILQFVAAGHSNGRIAAQLWVAEQTVKFHLSNIYRKLGVTNRTEASHYAHLHGLLALGAPAPRPVAAAA